MGLDVFDVLDGLEKAIPILGTVTGNPLIGALATKLLDIAEEEIQRRMNTQPGRNRSEILADAAATYLEAREENAKLKALGH